MEPLDNLISNSNGHNVISWRNKVFPIAVSVCVSFLFIYVISNVLGIINSSESQDSIGEVSRWCERISSSIFREPTNALSNLGFMFAGLSMLWILSRDTQNSWKKNRFHGITPISMLYAGTVIYLGPGSMLMHGTNTSWGGWADNLSMIMYIILPWLINIGKMGRWPQKQFFVIYTAIILVYAISRWFFGSKLGVNLDLFGLSIGLWIISEALFRFWSQKFRWLSGFLGFIVAAVFGIMPTEIFANLDKFWWVILFWIPAILSTNPPLYKRTYLPWFSIGMICYLLAFAVWLQGYPNTTFCNPDSLIQPHAIWHLMTAFSTWCFFKFLRTEKEI